VDKIYKNKFVCIEEVMFKNYDNDVKTRKLYIMESMLIFYSSSCQDCLPNLYPEGSLYSTYALDMKRWKLTLWDSYKHWSSQKRHNNLPHYFVFLLYPLVDEWRVYHKASLNAWNYCSE